VATKPRQSAQTGLLYPHNILTTPRISPHEIVSQALTKACLPPLTPSPIPALQAVFTPGVAGCRADNQRLYRIALFAERDIAPMEAGGLYWRCIRGVLGVY